VPAVKKWGNSLALRIPAHLARQLNLTEDTQVVCTVVDGALVVKPANERPPYTLDQLLDRITPENIHLETDTGGAMGKESW
jgi:antitoxin MazE